MSDRGLNTVRVRPNQAKDGAVVVQRYQDEIAANARMPFRDFIALIDATRLSSAALALAILLSWKIPVTERSVSRWRREYNSRIL